MAAKYTGIVRSWALAAEYPSPLIIVGRNNERAYTATACLNIRIITQLVETNSGDLPLPSSQDSGTMSAPNVSNKQQVEYKEEEISYLPVQNSSFHMPPFERMTVT